MGNMAGGSAAELEVVSAWEESEPSGIPELLGFQSTVHADGNDAALVLRTSIGRFELLASLSQIAAMHKEMESAALVMQYRQSMKGDAGISAFDALLKAAIRPAETFCIVEPETGDRLFVMHFSDRLPIVIRMSPEQVAISLEDLANVSRQTAN